MTPPVPIRSKMTARLKRQFAHRYPTVYPHQWYPVIRPGDVGFYVLLVSGELFVCWEHCDVRE